MSLTYGSFQVFPWNNDATIEKMDSCDWCHKITDFFQYVHSWNQGDIIISSYNISCYNCCCAETINLKECMAAIVLL